MSRPGGADALRAIASLQAEVAALSEQVTAATRAAAVAAEGSDDSGTVRVRLDITGRPADVRVEAGWRGALGDDGLAGAVRQAWQAAGLAKLTAWGEALAEPAPAGEGRPAAALPAGVEPGDLMSHRVQGNLSGLMSLLADAQEAVERAARTAAADAQATAEGSDPGGGVTAVVSAGHLADLRVDPGRVARASPDALGTAIRDAIAAALDELDRRAAAQLPPPLRELHELTADPLAMLRTVGLLRD